jgi:hypothetical protein
MIDVFKLCAWIPVLGLLTFLLVVLVVAVARAFSLFLRAIKL